jgi:signal transduction histidine kinase
VGHRDRLKQTFLNISVNALEAMPQGGILGLNMSVEGSVVRVSIEDDGRGIPKDVLERIYERDFTTKGSGSGIGLFVARTLVEMHGGEIRTESRVGEGTRVDVVLPILLRG